MLRGARMQPAQIENCQLANERATSLKKPHAANYVREEPRILVLQRPGGIVTPTTKLPTRPLLPYVDMYVSRLCNHGGVYGVGSVLGNREGLQYAAVSSKPLRQLARNIRLVRPLGHKHQMAELCIRVRNYTYNNNSSASPFGFVQWFALCALPIWLQD